MNMISTESYFLALTLQFFIIFNKALLSFGNRDDCIIQILSTYRQHYQYFLRPNEEGVMTYIPEVVRNINGLQAYEYGSYFLNDTRVNGDDKEYVRGYFNFIYNKLILETNWVDVLTPEGWCYQTEATFQITFNYCIGALQRFGYELGNPLAVNALHHAYHNLDHTFFIIDNSDLVMSGTKILINLLSTIKNLGKIYTFYLINKPLEQSRRYPIETPDEYCDIIFNVLYNNPSTNAGTNQGPVTTLGL